MTKTSQSPTIQLRDFTCYQTSVVVLPSRAHPIAFVLVAGTVAAAGVF